MVSFHGNRSSHGVCSCPGGCKSQPRNADAHSKEWSKQTQQTGALLFGIEESVCGQWLPMFFPCSVAWYMGKHFTREQPISWRCIVQSFRAEARSHLQVEDDTWALCGLVLSTLSSLCQPRLQVGLDSGALPCTLLQAHAQVGVCWIIEVLIRRSSFFCQDHSAWPLCLAGRSIIARFTPDLAAMLCSAALSAFDATCHVACLQQKKVGLQITVAPHKTLFTETLEIRRKYSWHSSLTGQFLLSYEI